MKTLVTGGAGFVGSNLCNLLVAQGFHVKVLDDFSSGKATYLDNVEVEIIDGSILDVPKLRQCLDGVEAVVHLAAAGNVIESIEKPHKNFEINVRGTICVLEAMKACCVPKIIFLQLVGLSLGTPRLQCAKTLSQCLFPHMGLVSCHVRHISALFLAALRCSIQFFVSAT